MKLSAAINWISNERNILFSKRSEHEVNWIKFLFRGKRPLRIFFKSSNWWNSEHGQTKWWTTIVFIYISILSKFMLIIKSFNYTSWAVSYILRKVHRRQIAFSHLSFSDLHFMISASLNYHSCKNVRVS